MMRPLGSQVTSQSGVPEDRVLVVVQLGGGNDGLNTVVPYGADEYYSLRPGLAIPAPGRGTNGRPEALAIDDGSSAVGLAELAGAEQQVATAAVAGGGLRGAFRGLGGHLPGFAFGGFAPPRLLAVVFQLPGLAKKSPF